MDRRPRITAFKGTFQTYNGVGSERICLGYASEVWGTEIAHPTDGNSRRQKTNRVTLAVNDHDAITFHMLSENKNIPLSLTHANRVWPSSSNVLTINTKCPGSGCRVVYRKIDPPLQVIIAIIVVVITVQASIRPDDP